MAVIAGGSCSKQRWAEPPSCAKHRSGMPQTVRQACPRPCCAASPGTQWRDSSEGSISSKPVWGACLRKW